MSKFQYYLPELVNLPLKFRKVEDWIEEIDLEYISRFIPKNAWRIGVYICKAGPKLIHTKDGKWYHIHFTPPVELPRLTKKEVDAMLYLDRKYLSSKAIRLLDDYILYRKLNELNHTVRRFKYAFMKRYN